MSNVTSAMHPILKYGQDLAAAISCLRLAGHTAYTLTLLYAAIDHMAWLSIEGELAGNKGFKAWVDKYMIEKNPVCFEGATSDDLWGARCGILHTFATESTEYFKGNAKRVFYRSNIPSFDSSAKDVIVLSLETISQAFVAGLYWFIDDLAVDQNQDAIAREKITRMLAYTTLG